MDKFLYRLSCGHKKILNPRNDRPKFNTFCKQCQNNCVVEYVSIVDVSEIFTLEFEVELSRTEAKYLLPMTRLSSYNICQGDSITYPKPTFTEPELQN